MKFTYRQVAGHYVEKLLLLFTFSAVLFRLINSSMSVVQAFCQTVKSKRTNVILTGPSFGLTRDVALSQGAYNRETKMHMMVPDSALATVNSVMVATIDADIAKISNDDFKTVFLGGIVVMCAGVLSAFIVGALLEARGGSSYEKLVLDTYLNDDNMMEDFLKSLNTNEEREKAREMIAKMRSDKDDWSNKQEISEKQVTPLSRTSNNADPETAASKVSSGSKELETAALSFDDYGDD